MKIHSLSNKVRNSILLAILLQSVLFGIGLAVSGTFTSTVNRPYRVMESQNAEKNSLMSGNLNNTLRIVNNMATEIGKLEDQKAIQDRLVDNLNHLMSVSRVFYMDLDSRTGYLYRDGESAIYSTDYGDISCEVGRPASGAKIALSSQWVPHFEGKYWEMAEQYWENKAAERQWIYEEGAMRYVIVQESGNHHRILGAEVGADMLGSYMGLDNPPYKGMSVLLLSEDQVLYSPNRALEGLTYEMTDGRIRMEVDGRVYDGVRDVLQIYGHMKEGTVYVGTICDHSELSSLSRDTVQMVVLVYIVSMAIAVVFSYVVINLVLKPLRKLREDIAGQRPEDVFFEPTGLMEIDDIHRALNDMTHKLEQSHSRYAFAMEATGELVGSFEYDKMGRRVKLSFALRKLLDIPESMVDEDNTILYEEWTGILIRMQPVEELGDVYWFEDSQHIIRAVTIRQQEEENSVFGMVVDKTDAFREIMRLRDLSQHDQLTGLYNAAYLKIKGQQYLDESRSKVNGLIFCDLDNLKYINDTYGHSTGDHYLQMMAGLLKDMSRGERGIPVRISGDEFALLFYGYDSREEIEKIVRDGYEKRPFMDLPDGIKCRINASVGLAYAQRETEDIGDLLKRADQAMYYVKRHLKNGIAIYGKPDGIE